MMRRLKKILLEPHVIAKIDNDKYTRWCEESAKDKSRTLEFAVNNIIEESVTSVEIAPKDVIGKGIKFKYSAIEPKGRPFKNYHYESSGINLKILFYKREHPRISCFYYGTRTVNLWSNTPAHLKNKVPTGFFSINNLMDREIDWQIDSILSYRNIHSYDKSEENLKILIERLDNTGMKSRKDIREKHDDYLRNIAMMDTIYKLLETCYDTKISDGTSTLKDIIFTSIQTQFRNHDSYFSIETLHYSPVKISGFYYTEEEKWKPEFKDIIKKKTSTDIEKTKEGNKSINRTFIMTYKERLISIPKLGLYIPSTKERCVIYDENQNYWVYLNSGNYKFKRKEDRFIPLKEKKIKQLKDVISGESFRLKLNWHSVLMDRTKQEMNIYKRYIRIYENFIQDKLKYHIK